MKTLTTIIAISILSLSCIANPNTEKIKELNTKAYSAYLNSSIFMWKQIVNESDKILFDKNSEGTDKIEALKFRFGLLSACLANKDKDTFNTYLKKTSDLLNELMKLHPKSSELYAISASIMGLQMGFSPMKGMTLGKLSTEHINKAIELDKTNPLAWKQLGSSKFFTPQMFGGNIKMSIEAYENAIDLFEKKNLTKNWLYIDSFAWLGLAYEKNGNPDKAKTTYEKALSIEPNFSWVRNNLLPNIAKAKK